MWEGKFLPARYVTNHIHRQYLPRVTCAEAILASFFPSFHPSIHQFYLPPLPLSLPLFLSLSSFFLNFFPLRFYLWETERETQAEREVGSLPTEPNVGLDPRTLGSRPELKADAQPLSHSGALPFSFLTWTFAESLFLHCARGWRYRHK